MSATGAVTPGNDDFEAGPVQAWLTQLVKASQGIKPGTSTTRPKITPSAKKKLKFTPPVGTQELAKELPFSVTYGEEPWDTPSERVESLSKAVKRKIRKKAAEAVKKKGESLVTKALDWKTWKTP